MYCHSFSFKTNKFHLSLSFSLCKRMKAYKWSLVAIRMEYGDLVICHLLLTFETSTSTCLFFFFFTSLMHLPLFLAFLRRYCSMKLLVLACLVLVTVGSLGFARDISSKHNNGRLSQEMSVGVLNIECKMKKVKLCDQMLKNSSLVNERVVPTGPNPLHNRWRRRTRRSEERWFLCFSFSVFLWLLYPGFIKLKRINLLFYSAFCVPLQTRKHAETTNSIIFNQITSQVFTNYINKISDHKRKREHKCLSLSSKPVKPAFN